MHSSQLESDSFPKVTSVDVKFWKRNLYSLNVRWREKNQMLLECKWFLEPVFPNGSLEWVVDMWTLEISKLNKTNHTWEIYLQRAFSVLSLASALNLPLTDGISVFSFFCNFRQLWFLCPFQLTLPSVFSSHLSLLRKQKWPFLHVLLL